MKKLRQWADEIEALKAPERAEEMKGLRYAADVMEIELLQDVACNVEEQFKGEDMDEFERSVWRR